MRVLRRTSACVALALIAGLASAPPAGSARAASARAASATSRSGSAPRLPAPVTLETPAGSFQIRRDGRVVRVAARPSPVPRDAAVFPGGAWYLIRHAHLLVGRGHKTLWRSRGEYAIRFQIGVVTIARGMVAFSYRSDGSEQLYMARLGHDPERRIARGEFPLGWTDGGVYTYRYRGRELRLRSDSGALERTVVRDPLSYEYDSTTGSLYFVNHRRLIRADGASTQRIATLAALGIAPKPAPALIPVAGLVELLGSNRLILVKPDGSVFAEAPIALANDNLSGSPEMDPAGAAVAYTVLAGQPANGTETVYLLRAGAHAAAVLHRERIAGGNPCERGAGVEWHGAWLLYFNSEGSLVVLDSTGRHRAIELSPIVRSLPGHPSNVSAYWSGAPPAL